MGITALWDVIKQQDRSVPIAQLAEEHFKRHGRPLRIAVDEADWRFNNLTAQQVYMIRESSNEPAYQGIEKSMFYRICRLLTLNVQLLFVFDGPGRPWKRGRRGQGRINYEERRLLKELLGYFRIPHHDAPGEAEAECARLQQLGVVDAVFSQDSDALMFGASILIRDDRVAKEKGNKDRSKENTKKSGSSVRVIHGRELQEAHNMDREGLVLFAMLCGGDYDTKGLPGCGAAMALRLVRAGLGTSLCQCRTKTDCAIWSNILVDCLRTQRGSRVVVPPNFPDIKILDKYNRPKVSTDEQLQNLRGLRNGWNHPIDELKLLEVTSSRFNIWGRLYMNWVGPVLLTKFLVARDPSLAKEHVHEVKFTKQRAKKTNEQTPPPLVKQLTFSPFGLTTLQRADFEGERAGYWTSSMQDPFEPEHRVKTEIPIYLLQKVLPIDVLDPPPAPKKTPRKRKRTADDEDAATTPASAAKRKRTPSTKQPASMTRDAAPSDNSLLEPRLPNTSRLASSAQRVQLPHRVRAAPSQAEYISLLSDSEEEISPSKRRCSVVDLGDELSDSTDEEAELDIAAKEVLPPVSRSGPNRDSMATTSAAAAEVRAARLRYFAVEDKEDVVALRTVSLAKQTSPVPQRQNRIRHDRQLLEDIETMDLT